MKNTAWSDDYLSGFSDIDKQNINLFKMINAFAESNDESASNQSVFEFLEELVRYSKSYFELEERHMKKNAYPLLAYHEYEHKRIRDNTADLRKKTKQDRLQSPFSSVADLVYDWLENHFIIDDLAYFDYFQNKDRELGLLTANRKCEVSTIENQFLFSGRIESVEKNKVVISVAKDRKNNVKLNDIVKVSSISDDQGTQTFSATAYFSSPKTLKLFNATVLQDENQRKFFRVLTDLDGSLRYYEKKHPVKIIDLSAGGIKVESDEDFLNDETVPVDFTIQDNHVLVLCKIVRVTGDEGPHKTYGLRFEVLKNTDSEKINSFVLSRQLLERNK